MMSAPILDPRTTIGHVHLKVADLERALAFYQDLLGFRVTTRFGDAAVFLSVGGYHHQLGLNTWESAGAGPPPPGHTGLYHAAILLPTRAELARVVKRLVEAGYPLTGAADHGVSEAVYLNDPDGNGVELYADRPRAQWPKDDKGALTMWTRPLDWEGLMAELDAPAG